MTTQLLKTTPLTNCPSCSFKQRRFLYEIHYSKVFECDHCKLRYLDPCLAPEAMKVAYESNDTLMEMNDFHEGYYDYGDLKTKTKTSKDFDRGLQMIESLLPRKGSLLDIGFGNGYFLAIAQQRGWTVNGIDSSSTNKEIALKKFGLKLACSGFENYETSEKFDAITFWDVVEHIPAPNEAIQKASRMLKPGGVILIAGPNDHSFLAILSGILYRLGLRQGVNKIYFLEHVSYYTVRTLETLMTSNKFSLKNYFFTSTDLAKYKLPGQDKLLASIILGLGTLLGLQNRVIAVFKKDS